MKSIELGVRRPQGVADDRLDLPLLDDPTLDGGQVTD